MVYRNSPWSTLDIAKLDCFPAPSSQYMRRKVLCNQDEHTKLSDHSHVIAGDQRHKFQPFVTIDERDVISEDDGNEEDGGDKTRQANEDSVHANVVGRDTTLQDAAVA